MESLKNVLQILGYADFTVQSGSFQDPGRHLTRYRSCTVHHYTTRQNGTVHLGIQPLLGKFQGIRLKGMEMALVWHEKSSRTALQFQTSTVTIHTLFWYLKTFKIYLYLKTLTVLFINKGNRQ